MADDSNNGPSDGTDDAGAETETKLGLPPRSPETPSQYRNRRLIQWGILSTFCVLTIAIGFHIVWAANHPSPIMTLDTSLQIIDGPIADPEDFGTEKGFRVTHVGDTRVITPTGYSTAVSAQTGSLVILRAAEIAPTEGVEPEVRLFANYNASEYPALQLGEDMRIESTTSFDMADLPIGPDYRITAVEGKPVTSREEYEAVLTEGLGRTVRITLESTNSDEPQVDIIFHALYWNVKFSHFFVGLLFGLFGCGVFWLKPDSRSSWGFLIFCLYVGVYWLLRSVPLEVRVTPERWLYYCFQCFLPLATLGFLITFSPLRTIVKRPTRILVAGLIFGVLLIASDWLTGRDSFDTFSLNSKVFGVWALSLLVLAVLTLPIDLIFRLAKVDLGATDRQRAKIIRIATALGFIPVTIFTLFWFQSHTDWPMLKIFFEMTVLLFPLIIGYAIVRHNLLQVSEFTLEALLYGVLFTGIGSAYLLIIGSASPLVEQFIPGSTDFTKTILIAGVSVLAIPVHGRMRTALATRYRRGLPDFDSLIEMIEEIGIQESLPQEFAKKAAAKIGKMSESSQVVILIRYPKNDTWLVGGAEPPLPLEKVSESCSSLIEFMTQSQRELSKDEIIEHVKLGDSRWALLEGFQVLNANVIFPMVARGRVVGAISLGDKSNYKNYSADELKSLNHVARQISLMLHSLISQQIDDPNTRIVDLYPAYPETIGPYTIEGFLGEGGMSYVYKGKNGAKHIAIKVAKRHIQANQTTMERFHREAEVMSKLDHKHVVGIIELGWEKSEPYIVLEYFPNGTLDAQFRDEEKISEVNALGYIMQTADGLKMALSEGIIHRDIKPKNLFLDDNFVIKIGDFGLAKLGDAATITGTGDIFGTPDYMAPEIFQGQRATWKSDQFALGVTLYEVLAGARPFHAENVEALIYQYIHSTVPDIRKRRKEISNETMNIIRRMMSKSPDERFDSYEELIEALETVMKGIE